MKKTILVMTFLVLIFCGCGKNENNKLIPIEKSYDDMQTLAVTIMTEKTVYSTKDTVIKFFINNPTGEEQAYIFDYTYLQKFDDGEWKIVAFKDEEKIFYDLGITIQANSCSEETLNLQKEFNFPLSKGKYRIVKDDTFYVMISNVFIIE